MATDNNFILGANTPYPSDYDSGLLCPILRKNGRQAIKIDDNYPFHGVDIWTAYEVSWLDLKGKPKFAIAEITVSCKTKNIVESKSLKLYLNSLNQRRCESSDGILTLMKKDIESCVEGPVDVYMYSLDDFHIRGLPSFSGILLDDLDVVVDSYKPDPSLLSVEESGEIVTETLYSHLLKTNCPVTNQPDWASIMIRYTGHPINAVGALKYIISYRHHQDFHEQCVERIYSEIYARCRPVELEVYARYCRRGGLDINPYRSSKKIHPPLIRISCQ
ncbi:MAG: NADPH-dependent 7-cyano-7-deazaguanine reductase QueF [Pseudomonadales bacterium]|jgi:7-cyano-7-deazaguanine reductase|tara:strand:+ start:2015 stop:2839 length:825 start_codon:yes stop_codon:yes gene_type:complete